MENGDISQNSEVEKEKQNFIMIGKKLRKYSKNEQNAIKILKNRPMCVCCTTCMDKSNTNKNMAKWTKHRKSH